MKRLVLPGIVIGALVAQPLLVAAPASAATTRYAAPGASGTACSSTAPCGLDTAVGQAASGDEVVVAPGTYSFATSITAGVSNLNIHGVAGQPRPVLVSSAPRAVDIGQSGIGARITDLTIVHTGTGYGLNVFAKNTLIQRVSVTSAGAVACSPGISGTLRDSLCTTSAAGGIAVDDSWSGDLGQLNLRNVTAVATGAASYGIRADAGSGSILVVDVRNTIAAGTAADVRSTESGSNSNSLVTVRNSNFDAREEAGGGSVSAPTSNDNQTAPPVFVDTVTYRQRIGSPTIDRGTRYDGLGTVDLDGDPRVTGAAPDIGVDELDVTPPDTLYLGPTRKKLHKLKVTFRFGATEPATYVCKVDRKPPKPCTSPYKRKLKRYGKHKITVTATDAVGNVDATPVTHKVKVKKKKHRRKKP